MIINSRIEVIDLLNGYKDTQREWVYQFWMPESEW